MFYLEGFLFAELDDTTSHSTALFVAWSEAKKSSSKTVILIYRHAGQKDLICTKVRDLGDSKSFEPITKRNVMKLALLKLLEAGA